MRTLGGPSKAPVAKRTPTVTYAEAVKETPSSKATDEKTKENLKAEAEHLELVLDTLPEDSPLRRFPTRKRDP